MSATEGPSPLPKHQIHNTSPSQMKSGERSAVTTTVKTPLEAIQATVQQAQVLNNAGFLFEGEEITLRSGVMQADAKTVQGSLPIAQEQRNALGSSRAHMLGIHAREALAKNMVQIEAAGLTDFFWDQWMSSDEEVHHTAEAEIEIIDERAGSQLWSLLNSAEMNENMCRGLPPVHTEVSLLLGLERAAILEKAPDDANARLAFLQDVEEGKFTHAKSYYATFGRPMAEEAFNGNLPQVALVAERVDETAVLTFLYEI